MSNKYFTFILILLFFSLCFIILNNSTSSITAINNSAIIKKYTFKVFPQGWGFFTRNPRENLTKCYIFDESYKNIITQCSSSKYVFGLDRACRAKHAELEVLLSQVQDSLWKKRLIQKDSLSLVFSNEKLLDTVVNVFHSPSIFGEVILVKEDRLPWAWSQKKFLINPPIKYAKVFVAKN